MRRSVWKCNEKSGNQQVEVCGWVDKRRDHGGVIFYRFTRS